MKKVYFFLICVLFNYNIFGSCGSASCPLHVNTPFSKGLFFLKLSHEYIYQNQIFIGSNKSFVGAIPQHHDEVSTLNQLTYFSLGYGIFDFLSIDFSIPYVHREHSHIHKHDGGEIRESWNFSGFGDMTLLSHLSFFNNSENNYSINFTAGIKLPTGVTDALNDEGEAAEVTIQPGTGSTDFIFGAQYSTDILSVPNLTQSSYSAFPLSFSVNYKWNTKGTDDYKFGNELLLHLSTAYRFMEKAAILFQLNAKFQDRADIGGTNEPRESTGGEWLFVSPGLKFYLIDSFSLYGYFQIPVYQNVNGIQQAAAYNLQLGLQQEINLVD